MRGSSGVGVPPQRLEAHRGRRDRGAPQDPRVVHHEREEGGLGLGPVDEGESFLGTVFQGVSFARCNAAPAGPASGSSTRPSPMSTSAR
jgi:hypothetical protein